MALTNPALVAADMRRKEWELDAWKAGRDSNFWFQSGFVGKGSSDSLRPVHYVKELTRTKRGDQCVMHLIADAAGDGVAGDNTVKGTDESMVISTVTLTIDQYRKKMTSAGRMAEQKTVVRFAVQAKDILGNWLGQSLEEMGFLTASGFAYANRLDGTPRPATSQMPQLAFAADVTAPSAARVFYAGAASSTATLTDADKMSWRTIVSAVGLARYKRLKPMRHNGRECYGVVMSEQNARDLKLDPDYMTNVGRAAQQGNKNPLFNNYFAEIDGVYLFSHNKVRTTLGLPVGQRFGAGGAVHGSQSLLFGAQAVGFARIGNPYWDRDNDDDAGNQDNLVLGVQVGYKKPVYASVYDGGANEDFGVISLFSAAKLQ